MSYYWVGNNSGFKVILFCFALLHPWLELQHCLSAQKGKYISIPSWLVKLLGSEWKRAFDNFLLYSCHVLMQFCSALWEWNIQFVCLSLYFSSSFPTYSNFFTCASHFYLKALFLLEIKKNWLTVNNKPYKMSLHLFHTSILILLLPYCHFRLFNCIQFLF